MKVIIHYSETNDDFSSVFAFLDHLLADHDSDGTLQPTEAQIKGLPAADSVG